MLDAYSGDEVTFLWTVSREGTTVTEVVRWSDEYRLPRAPEPATLRPTSPADAMRRV